MSKYNEEPKGDTRPITESEKDKFKTNIASEKIQPGTSGSQDARRHAESSKHGKR